MMLDNSSYNKVKIVYKLSSLLWFIEKHALLDAQVSGDRECQELLIALQKDLQKHIEKFRTESCSVTQ